MREKQTIDDETTLKTPALNIPLCFDKHDFVLVVQLTSEPNSEMKPPRWGYGGTRELHVNQSQRSAQRSSLECAGLRVS